MGSINSIPIISQVKSLVQVIGGDAKGAKQTQEDFSRQCPLVSQIRSGVELLSGDEDAALETQKIFLKGTGETLNGIANAVPVVGHVKGGIHYACGDKEGGDRAMKSASRTIGVVGGGIVGTFTGGPVGAVVGGIAGGQAMDGITTGIDSWVHKEYRPNGSWAGFHHMVTKRDIGAGFDSALGLGLDGVAGLGAGKLTNGFKANKIDVANPKVGGGVAPSPAGGAMSTSTSGVLSNSIGETVSSSIGETVSGSIGETMSASTLKSLISNPDLFPTNPITGLPNTLPGHFPAYLPGYPNPLLDLPNSLPGYQNTILLSKGLPSSILEGFESASTKANTMSSVTSTMPELVKTTTKSSSNGLAGFIVRITYEDLYFEPNVTDMKSISNQNAAPQKEGSHSMNLNDVQLHPGRITYKLESANEIIESSTFSIKFRSTPSSNTEDIITIKVTKPSKGYVLLAKAKKGINHLGVMFENEFCISSKNSLSTIKKGILVLHAWFTRDRTLRVLLESFQNLQDLLEQRLTGSEKKDEYSYEYWNAGTSCVGLDAFVLLFSKIQGQKFIYDAPLTMNYEQAKNMSFINCKRFATLICKKFGLKIKKEVIESFLDMQYFKTQEKKIKQNGWITPEQLWDDG